MTCLIISSFPAAKFEITRYASLRISFGAEGSKSRVMLLNKDVRNNPITLLFGPDVILTTVRMAGTTTLGIPRLYKGWIRNSDLI